MMKQKLARYIFLTLTLVGLLLVLGLGAADFPISASQRIDGVDAAYFPILTAKPTSGVDLKYGIVFISSAEAPADALQYQNGLSLNPEWNRYPLYWFNVETSPGVYDWSASNSKYGLS